MASRQSGFTLIEILVVLALVAILSGFAIFAVRGSDPDVIVRAELERLFKIVRLAQDESMFRRQSLGLYFFTGGYHFFTMTDDGWQPVIDDRFFTPQTIRRDVDITLYVEARPVTLDTEAAEEAEPQLFFIPDTDAQPFEIIITASGAKDVTLRRYPSGKIEMDDALR